MTIELVHDDLLTTVVELRDVAANLAERRRRTDLAVDVLLDGGWSGRAASAYLEGWEDWRAGCDQVLDALSAMAELIGACHADQVEQDELATARLTGLAEKVADRAVES